MTKGSDGRWRKAEVHRGFIDGLLWPTLRDALQTAAEDLRFIASRLEKAAGGEGDVADATKTAHAEVKAVLDFVYTIRHAQVHDRLAR